MRGRREMIQRKGDNRLAEGREGGGLEYDSGSEFTPDKENERKREKAESRERECVVKGS